MANLRIQDLGENANADTNNDFAMTFNDNSESKTRLRDLFYSMVPDGAVNHNNVVRYKNLGAYDATHAAAVANGTYHDIFPGDYFTINGSQYVVEGCGYNVSGGDTYANGQNLIMMPKGLSQTLTQTLAPDSKTTHYMNDTDTTEGGFAGSKLYKTYLPQIQQKLEQDFGSHLVQFRTVVSTHVDANGAADQAEWRDAKLSIPNEVMVYGTVINGNTTNNGWNNIGNDDTQLPLMRMDSEERNNHRNNCWLRDVHSASGFAFANGNGDDNWSSASATWYGVRAFFLIR